MFGILILGYFGVKSMKIIFFFEIFSWIISIQMIYFGVLFEEIEEGIIIKVEDNFKGFIGVECYILVSSENSGNIIVEVFKGYDIDFVLQDVKNVVDCINFFFVGMEFFVIYKCENFGFVINIVLSGDVSLVVLKCYVCEIEDDFLVKDGFLKVIFSGFFDEEIEIVFCECDLRVYGLIFQEVLEVVCCFNVDIIGGIIKGEKEEVLVCVCSKEYYVDGLCDIVVKNIIGGGVVCLYQVVDVCDCWVDLFDCFYFNGQLFVIIIVQNILEEDMIIIMDMVKEYIEDFNVSNSEV